MAVASGLPDKLRLEPHGAKSINLARDVMLAIDQANVLHLGSGFDRLRRSLNGQVLDDNDGVSVLKRVAVGVQDLIRIPASKRD